MTTTTNISNNNDDLFVGLDKHKKELCLRLQADDPTLQDPYLDTNGKDNNELQYVFAVGRSLISNTRVRTFKIYELWLTVPVAHALANGIRQCKVEYMELEGQIGHVGSPYTSPESHEIRQIIHRAIQESQTIRRLAWVSSRLDADALVGLGDILSSLQTLEGLTITTIFNPNQVAQLLAESLHRSTTITELKIKLYSLSDAVMTNLVQEMCRTSSITHLDLLGGMGDVGTVRMLVEQATTLSDQELPLRLRRLGVRDSNLTTEGLQLLMQAVIQDRFPFLQELDLSCNKNMGFAGEQIIGEALRHLPPHLERIDFSEGRLHDRNRATQAILNGIQHNCHIKHLGVGNDLWFTNDFNRELYFYLTLNRNGRYLLSQHHGLAPTVWCRILSKFQQDHQDGASCIYYYLREMPTILPTTPRQR